MTQCYQVLSRRYRPKDFDEIVGQDVVVSALKNAVVSGKIGHAYLFCGSRGTGKTSTARVLAKAINCEHNTGGNPCNQCSSCTHDSPGSNGIFELDAASNNSVEDIRNIVEQVRFAPTFSKYKVFIIDEVHMLSQAAFNTLLKTLEEPPTNAVFIFATTEKNKVIPTVVSRCQVMDFYSISERDILQNLRVILNNENIKYEDNALSIVAERADGAMRDALSMTEAVISHGYGVTYDMVTKSLNITNSKYYLEICEYIVNKNHAGVILCYNEMARSGVDGLQFMDGLLRHFRSLLLTYNDATKSLLSCCENEKQMYISQANAFDKHTVINAIMAINEWSLSYKDSINKRFHVEAMLMKLINLNSVVS